MKSILKTLHDNFTRLPENLPAQYSEASYYRFMVTANFGYLSRINIDYGDVARRFVNDRVHRYPVTDRGTLVGIVTTMDLVRLIADRRLKH